MFERAARRLAPPRRQRHRRPRPDRARRARGRHLAAPTTRCDWPAISSPSAEAPARRLDRVGAALPRQCAAATRPHRRRVGRDERNHRPVGDRARAVLLAAASLARSWRPLLTGEPRHVRTRLGEARAAVAGVMPDIADVTIDGNVTNRGAICARHQTSSTLDDLRDAGTPDIDEPDVTATIDWFVTDGDTFIDNTHWSSSSTIVAAHRCWSSHAWPSTPNGCTIVSRRWPGATSSCRSPSSTAAPSTTTSPPSRRSRPARRRHRTAREVIPIYDASAPRCTERWPSGEVLATALHQRRRPNDKQRAHEVAAHARSLSEAIGHRAHRSARHADARHARPLAGAVIRRRNAASTRSEHAWCFV